MHAAPSARAQTCVHTLAALATRMRPAEIQNHNLTNANVIKVSQATVSNAVTMMNALAPMQEKGTSAATIHGASTWWAPTVVTVCLDT